MSSLYVNINALELVKYTKKLEKLHKSALPVAIRKTLNDVAFYAKEKTLIPTFKDKFINRQKNFIKSSSKANRSKNTFDISKMASEFGIIQGKSGAADRLHLQETGGKISGREKIAQNPVRVGRKLNRKVAKKMRFGQFKNRPNGRISWDKKRSIFKTNKGVFQIEKNKGFSVLYLTNRDVKIDKHPFLMPAAIKAAKKTPEIYGKIALERIKRGFK